MTLNHHTQAIPLILALDKSGCPMAWVHWKKAVSYILAKQLAWSFGDVVAVLRGGINRQGQRSLLELPPVIAVAGASAARMESHTVALSNKALFVRDGHTCLYCGRHYPGSLLTRDHVVPKGQGGPDIWENVVTACRACNCNKECRTPEQAGMPLLALPYAPSHIEGLILSNRRIVADQAEFLRQQLPRGSKLAI